MNDIDLGGFQYMGKVKSGIVSNDARHAISDMNRLRIGARAAQN